MRLTPDQRRQRLFDMMAADPEFTRIKTGLEDAKTRFQRHTAWLPPKLRSRLHEYPGMMYFLYQRIIDTVCRQMRFNDED